MDAKDTVLILSVGTGLLAKTRGVASVANRKAFGVHIFAHVVGRNGLLRRGNQVLFFAITDNLQRWLSSV